MDWFPAFAVCKRSGQAAAWQLGRQQVSVVCTCCIYWARQKKAGIYGSLAHQQRSDEIILLKRYWLCCNRSVTVPNKQKCRTMNQGTPLHWRKPGSFLFPAPSGRDEHEVWAWPPRGEGGTVKTRKKRMPFSRTGVVRQRRVDGVSNGEVLNTPSKHGLSKSELISSVNCKNRCTTKPGSKLKEARGACLFVRTIDYYHALFQVRWKEFNFHETKDGVKKKKKVGSKPRFDSWKKRLYE